MDRDIRAPDLQDTVYAVSKDTGGILLYAMDRRRRITEGQKKMTGGEAAGSLSGSKRHLFSGTESVFAAKKTTGTVQAYPAGAALKGRRAKDNVLAFLRIKSARADRAAALSVLLPSAGVLAALLLFLVMIPLLLVGALAGTGGVSAFSATYQESDERILAANHTYVTLEEAFKEELAHIEEKYPGFDEYRYDLCEVTHDPYELASYLSAKYLYYDGVTEEILQEIFDAQYLLSMEEKEEEKTVEVTDPDTGEINTQTKVIRVLSVTLTGRSIGEIAKEGLSGDDLSLYLAYQQTAGSRLDLFGADGADSNYEYYYGEQIPADAEAIGEEDARQMAIVALSQRGKPYVYGAAHGADYGSEDPAAFDCSSFVCWVIDHSVGHVGISDTNGLLARCDPVSSADARPGDLIFFQKTYSYPGASHVGIYLGEGKMIHAGNPVKVSAVDTSYWQAHFLTFGRLRSEYRNGG